MNPFIVAEVTKNWDSQTPIGDTLSQQFETVINFNHERGYRLTDWKINTVVANGIFTETIIAIFTKLP